MVNEKLVECRHWHPWAARALFHLSFLLNKTSYLKVTEYWMNSQMDKVTAQTAVEKEQRVRAFRKLQDEFKVAKQRWALENARRLKLLDFALQKVL